jgi:hypothetical protein
LFCGKNLKLKADSQNESYRNGASCADSEGQSKSQLGYKPEKYHIGFIKCGESSLLEKSIFYKCELPRRNRNLLPLYLIPIGEGCGFRATPHFSS